MKEKRTFYCEIAYVIGIIALAFGTAFMEKADFGMSMIVAPAYLIHLKVSQYFSFFTFGMSEYIFQALLLVLLSIVMHRVKKGYLLSFATAFLYGIILDFFMSVAAIIPNNEIAWRVVFYIVGMLMCTFGVALLFRTYIPPEAYELFVKELSQKYGVSIERMKTLYDFVSLALSIILSFVFFGFGVFVGVSWGTLVCAILNGWLIGINTRFLDRFFVFKDALKLRGKIGI